MSLDYPITRPFTWRWFTPISLASAVVAIAILSVINTALVGYETITVFQSNFNVIQTHWYDGFMLFRKSKPGTLCDSHVFNVGDPFRTTYSFFQWTIDSITQPNAGESGIAYSGAPLVSCDVVSVYLDGNLLSWTMDFTVIAVCMNTDSFNITARTSFSRGLLQRRYSPSLGLIRLLNDGTEDIRGSVLDGLMCIAAQELGTRGYNALLFSNRSSPIALSAQADFNYCPMSLGLNAPCATNPPHFDILSTAVVYPNSTIHCYTSGNTTHPTWNSWGLDNDTRLALYNLFQTVYASIRIDLGNPSPNNFILNPTALNGTIAPTFPLTRGNGEAISNSTLYEYWSTPIPSLQKHLPVTITGPAAIQMVYPCQFHQRKRLGQLVISVFVATISMFSTGWAMFMLVMTAIAKRNNPTANRCEDHFRHRLDLESSWFDSMEIHGFLNGQVAGPVRRVTNATRPSGAIYQSIVHSPSCEPSVTAIDIEILDNTSGPLLNAGSSTDS